MAISIQIPDLAAIRSIVERLSHESEKCLAESTAILL
jgi:hypothetical protein